MNTFNLHSTIFKATFAFLFSYIYFSASSQTVSTVAGNGIAGFADGAGTNAEFNHTSDVASDTLGNFYIPDNGNARIRKATSTWVVSTLAGNGIQGYVDGNATNAEFKGPSKVAIDTAGNVYVADNGNNVIRKVTSTGVVSTLAGNGVAGFADGAGTSAEFNNPSGIAVDLQGNVYVGDFYNNRIRKITKDGVVSTFAGNGIAGYVDGAGANAEFNSPRGVAFDKQGNLYVVDCVNNYIRKITTSGVVSTLAGNGIPGYIDGLGTNAEFNFPAGITVDAQGNAYVADQSNNVIRKITTTGVVSTLAGNGVAGYVDGAGTTAEFNSPRGVGVDAQGNVYVADAFNNNIRKITLSTLPITLLNFQVQLQKNNVILNWQTATEINTSYFNVQRSNDGVHFNTINKITAAGNSSNIKSYSYTDEGVSGLSAGKLYYRLSEIDNDGKNNYSSIRTVNLSNIHWLFFVSPNPAKDYINIVSSYNVNAVQVKITDMNGKTLSTSKQDFISGQQLKISLSHFPSGILVVTIKSANSHEQFKIIKD